MWRGWVASGCIREFDSEKEWGASPSRCTRPPWAWMYSCTMDSPIPVPRTAFSGWRSPRKKGSNTWALSAGATPGPWSDTSISTAPDARETAKRTVPCSGEKRMALDSRLPTAEAIFSGSSCKVVRSPLTSTRSWRACHCRRWLSTRSSSRPMSSVSRRCSWRASNAAALKRSSASISLCSTSVFWCRICATSFWPSVSSRSHRLAAGPRLRAARPAGF